MQRATNEEDLKELMDSDEYDFRYDIGIAQSADAIRLADKEKIVPLMAKHFTILSVKAELDQILCGLSSTLSVLELVRENRQTMRQLFVYNPTPLMSWEELFDLLPPVMSPEGRTNESLKKLLL